MDELQLKVRYISRTAGSGQHLQRKVPLRYWVAGPGATFGRLASVPLCLTVHGLESAWDGSVVLAHEEGIGVRVGEVRVDVFP